MAKEIIILIHPSGSEREFDPDQAARLMGMVNNGGWKWKDEADAEILETLRVQQEEEDCGCSEKQSANATIDGSDKGDPEEPKARKAGKGSRRTRSKDKVT